MQKRIVIAEDDPITRMDISEILKEAGYDVVGLASDGLDVIELSKELKPDVVLMDIKMPILDGIKAAKILIDEEIVSCIVLLTAYSTKELIEEAKNTGVTGYIMKPISEENLLPAIEIALAKDEEIRKIEERYEETKTKLEERKYIEKAKGLLMSKYNISEEAAYNSMRKLSMDKRMSMLEVSKVVILNYGEKGAVNELD